MSICNCPTIGVDGIEDSKQKNAVDMFIRSLQWGDTPLGDSEWSLLSVTKMAEAGNDLETISSCVPFRGGSCRRSMRCCGVCTRQCKTRCIQDCLHRLYMWSKLVKNTPVAERDNIPLGIRLAVAQKFESHAQLSWVVGEILSQKTNSNVKEYMRSENLHPWENPYKIDYAPQVEIDPSTGKRRINPGSGELCFTPWPQSGLCPYCLPDVTVDGRTARKVSREIYGGGEGRKD